MMSEQISALMDDELNDTHDMSSCLDGICKDQRLRQDWALYHLISEHLRGDSTMAIDCLPRLNEHLAVEPAATLAATNTATILTPRRRNWRTVSWLSFSALAVAMGVFAVAWMAWSMSLNPANPGAESMEIVLAPSAAPTVTVMPTSSSPMESNRDYLIAHQGVSPSGVLQGVSAYVRTVAETQSSSTARGANAR